MLSLVIYRLKDVLIVKIEALSLNLGFDIWVLWEDLLMHPLFGESKAFHIFDKCHVDELTLAIVNNVMITNQVSLGGKSWTLLDRRELLAY